MTATKRGVRLSRMKAQNGYASKWSNWVFLDWMSYSAKAELIKDRSLDIFDKNEIRESM